MLLHPDRLFASDQSARRIARELFAQIENLPIISPHGHTDPSWWGGNVAFADPASLFVTPDHYVTRMLTSQGVPFQAMGIGEEAQTDPREIWRVFASHFYLFRATPSRLWIEHSLQDVFSITQRLSSETADDIYDAIADCLTRPEFFPRAIYDRFGMEVIATTDGPFDDLAWHRRMRESDWHGRVLPTYRPDAVTDPDQPGFAGNLERFAQVTGIDLSTWAGYLDAHRTRRAFFRDHGATATDHGHPTPLTADLPENEAALLYERARSGRLAKNEAELFRAQMLTEMARMSAEDGMVMQLHSGSLRNHSMDVFTRFGRDRGFDIPFAVSFTEALQPLLNAVGHEEKFRLILFTLDEATYSRELAPLAGAWPSLLLGPPWWFHDSFEGIRRYRQSVTETAGFYNTAGFNDDTRAILSIKARHDVARRTDCAFLAELVTTHRLDEDEAHEIARLLAGDMARRAYKL